MASSSANTKGSQFGPLQHLLKAPNKETVVKICNQAVLYKDLTAASYPEAAITELSSSLGITKGESKQVFSSLSQLLRKAMFVCASDPAAVSTVFPDGFHKNLQQLLIGIINNNFVEWKTYIVSDNTSLPRLLDVKWRVDNSIDQPDDELNAKASCILQLKLENCDSTNVLNMQHVDVKLTSEKLSAMLDGLGKIKDQLDSVSNR